MRLTFSALRSWGIRIPSAWPVNPIKERNFELTTKAGLQTTCVAKSASRRGELSSRQQMIEEDMQLNLQCQAPIAQNRCYKQALLS